MSDRTDSQKQRRIRKTGGYRKLRAFQTTTLIYDATVKFVRKFIERDSRTIDQMVQAARSGRQNIAEGNRAGAVSSHSELKLTNVARASLEELLLDFEDYLRQNDLPLWDKDSREAQHVRNLGKYPTDRSDLSDPADAGDRSRYAHYQSALEHEKPEVRANSILCLIHQANYLLDQQLVKMEETFMEEGGYKEQLFSARILKRKNRSDPSDRTDARTCPDCGQPMAIRTAKTGPNEGSQFWGCTAYPGCKATAPA